MARKTDERDPGAAGGRRATSASGAGAVPLGREPDRVAERPIQGDVVVGVTGPVSTRFTLRQVPGYPQISLASRESAVACACHFAADHFVDAWIDEGQHPVRLVRRRVKT